MSIREVLHDKVHGPYFRPPPLKIRVLAAREQTRVLSWEFGETTATPKAVKLNKVLAISDGQHFVKVTVFEEFSSKIKPDASYLMRGYSLRGQSPPYALLVTRDTQFLRTSPVAVSEELAGEALSALFPPSSLTNIGQVRGKRGLLTVEGQAVEISAVKKILVGREQVPKRTVRLQEGDHQIEVALWREAAVHKVELGAQVRLSHLRFGSAAFVDQLQSTVFTAVEIQANVTKHLSCVEVLGVLESEEEGRLYLVLDDDVQYKVESSLWEPLEEELRKRRLFVGVEVVGGAITTIQVVEAPQES
ncbi:uncharacterized protein ACNS7B_003453 [Menidia menidia]